MIKLDAKQLRKGKGLRVKGKVKKQEIYIILDNVLDTYNIGSIFRLVDAAAGFIAKGWIILPGVLCGLCQEIYRNHGRKNK